MEYAFLCEFEELRSPLRDALSQVPSFPRNKAICTCDQGTMLMLFRRE